MTALTKPPVAPHDFITAMGHAVTGVAVVTTDGSNGRYGLTVSAVSSVSAEPPLMLVCINRRSPAMTAIDANGIFAVNFLAAAHRAYAETFSGKPREGQPFDFANHDWHDSVMGLPLVRGATAAFECQTHHSLDAGTHRIFIGQVIATYRSAAEPLVYCNRAYARILPYEGQ